MANMLLPEEFVTEVYRLVALLDGHINDPQLDELRSKIESQIEAKIEALKKREAFTKYKSSGQGSEREAARKEYLDLAGIHKDWRSQKEIKPR